MGQAYSSLTSSYVSFWARLGVRVDAEFGVVGAGSIFRCSVLSFLAYFVPLALVRRKLKDPHHLRAAMAFGGFSFTYRTVRLLIARYVPERNVDVHIQAPFIAGAAGAATCSVIDNSYVSSLFLIWWLFRSLRTLEAVNEFQQSKWGPTILMCASAEFLAPPALFSLEDHHVSYQKFLAPFWTAAGDRYEQFSQPPKGVTIGTNLVGPNGSMVHWWMRYVYGVVAQTVKVYFPLHLVWGLFRLPAWTPPSVILSNTARSSAFLSAYVLSLQALLLANSSLAKGLPPRWQVHLWTWASGFSVLLERTNRQAELAFFCASHAVNSLYNHAKRRGIVRPNFALGMILGMFATGLIMKHNAERPGRTMHLLFGELKGRKSQLVSQKKSIPAIGPDQRDGSGRNVAIDE
jgi:hypothetical protein